MDYITAAVMIISVISCSILGRTLVQNKYNDTTKGKYRELLDLEKQTAAKWKTLYQQQKGKNGQLLRGPTLPEDTDPEDFEKSIPMLIENAKNLPLPPWIKGVLNTPGASKWISDLAKQYPNQAKQFISSFISSPQLGDTQSQDQQQITVPGESA